MSVLQAVFFIHPSTKGSTHQRKEVFFMQFLTHLIFLLNLLKTLINHFS